MAMKPRWSRDSQSRGYFRPTPVGLFNPEWRREMYPRARVMMRPIGRPRAGMMSLARRAIVNGLNWPRNTEVVLRMAHDMVLQ
jgi:hypothetical protein